MGLLQLAILSLNSLEQAVGGSVLTYPAIVGAVALDSVLPVAPGETVVITAGVLAADGGAVLPLVFLAGLAGGLIGDNVSYGLGASVGRRAERRLFRSERASERVEWARRQLARHGAPIIVAARFIPGGRTATTFAAGTLEMPWRRFLAIDAVAAAAWAAYASLLGYFGGSAFADSLWKPLAVAIVAALVVSGLAELVRRYRLRQ